MYAAEDAAAYGAGFRARKTRYYGALTTTVRVELTRRSGRTVTHVDLDLATLGVPAARRSLHKIYEVDAAAWCTAGVLDPQRTTCCAASCGTCGGPDCA